MFNYIFFVTYTTESEKKATDNFEVVQETQDIFAARAQLVYNLSRTPGVFAPFSFEHVMTEEFFREKWIPLE